jgi:hypothetical protein
MAGPSEDPTVIHSLVIHLEDLFAAFEVTRQRGRQAVLRVTPPFSGRTRARLHVPQDDEYDAAPRPVHVAPERLLAENAPEYPHPDVTEDALRDDPDHQYTVERHRERHEAAVETWRASARDYVRDSITIKASGTAWTADVVVLG